jgi:hypothetical protein
MLSRLSLETVQDDEDKSRLAGLLAAARRVGEGTLTHHAIQQRGRPNRSHADPRVVG